MGARQAVTERRGYCTKAGGGGIVGISYLVPELRYLQPQTRAAQHLENAAHVYGLPRAL